MSRKRDFWCQKCSANAKTERIGESLRAKRGAGIILSEIVIRFRTDGLKALKLSCLDTSFKKPSFARKRPVTEQVKPAFTGCRNQKTQFEVGRNFPILYLPSPHSAHYPSGKSLGKLECFRIVGVERRMGGSIQKPRDKRSLNRFSPTVCRRRLSAKTFRPNDQVVQIFATTEKGGKEKS